MRVNTATLIARREARGLYQKDLAELVGVSFGHISNIEAGRHQPSPPVLARIADALDVPAADLMLDDEDVA